MLAKEKRRLDAKHLDLGQHNFACSQRCCQACIRIQIPFQSIIVEFLLGEIWEEGQREGYAGGRRQERLDAKHLDRPQSTNLPAVNAFVDIFSLQSCINPHQNVDLVLINLVTNDEFNLLVFLLFVHIKYITYKLILICGPEELDKLLWYLVKIIPATPLRET